MRHKYVKNTWIQVSVVRMRTSNMFDTALRHGCPNEQNLAYQTREQKKSFKLFDRMFDGLLILSHTIKQHQKKVAKR